MISDNYIALEQMLEELRQEYTEVSEMAKSNTELTSLANKLYAKIATLETVLKEERNKSIGFFKYQENERYRISRELHDSSLQNITHIIHKIELSSLYIEKDPARARLELLSVNQSLRTIIDDIRNTIYNLRPLEVDELGLVAICENMINAINADQKYIIDFSMKDVSCENSVMLLVLCRTIQECVINIVKHADASKITIQAKSNGEIYYIHIEDNGKGFCESDLAQKKNKHFGLSLIRERVNILKGKVTISSSNKGTIVELEIPIKELNG